MNPKGDMTMTIKTKVKAGALTSNHSGALKVRSQLKAGGLTSNHNASVRV
jgi:hypothetical protein